MMCARYWCWLLRMVLLLAVLPVNPAALPVAAAPNDLPSEFTLEAQGLGDQVLRGSSASLDIYFPGPGRYILARPTEFVLILSYSEILDPNVSTVTVLFNDIPVRTWFLAPQTAAQRETVIPLPSGLDRPDYNHVQLRFIMRLRGEGCGDTEHPALTATIYKKTRLRYFYAPGYPRTPPADPDLGRFPATLLEPSSLEPDRMTVVVPDRPALSDLRAAANVAAAVGRYTIGRNVAVKVVRASDAGELLRTTTVVVVGRPSEHALWEVLSRRARELPVPLVDRQRGQFRDREGRDVGEHEGVLMDVVSPWEPALRTVIVSGATDEAVVRASVALASITARKALHNDAAVVTEQPQELRGAGGEERSLTDFTFADLGDPDRTVNGWGMHAVTISFDTTGVPERGANATIYYDYSTVANPNVSAITVILNDIPVVDARFKAERAGRSTLEVPLPARALRSGRNSLVIRFNLAPYATASQPPVDDRTAASSFVCTNVPPELAWGVVYSDSIIHLPPGTAGSAGLGSFPFPFVREGKARDLLLVLPNDLVNGEEAGNLAAEFGRQINSDVLDLHVATASSLTAEQRRAAHLVLFGLPGANPVIQELAPSLPLRLDANGRIVEGDVGVLAGIRDGVSLGVLQTVPSPFNDQRAVLVVTGTTPEGLALAVRGLRQGGLRGNLATVQAPEAGTTFLRIRTFDIPTARPQVVPTLRVEEAAPNLLAAAFAAGAVLLLALTGFSLLRAARRRAVETGEAGGAEALVEDWMEGLEREPTRAR